MREEKPLKMEAHHIQEMCASFANLQLWQLHLQEHAPGVGPGDLVWLSLDDGGAGRVPCR